MNSFFKIKNFLCAQIFLWVILALVCSRAQAGSLTPEADQMYKKYHGAILQVRVIARGSKEKSSLGSGFFFTKDGLVATNYHVVADAVNFPKLFYVEAIFSDATIEAMEILNIDPVHDLAILKTKATVGQVLALGDSHLEKGKKIFSFGNPYDLGMIIVEGLFNGLLEHSRYPKILFSGSLNPGMSGGPALGSDGRVLGVNVSSSGDEISFFVPIDYLKKIYDEVQFNNGQPLGPNWKNVIRKHLVLEGHELIGGMLAVPWVKTQIGTVQVPGQISDVFRCWGESGDNTRYFLIGTYMTCSTEDSIYLSNTMRTGQIVFNYNWYEARGNDPVRFYNVFEDYSKYRQGDFENGEERDLSNFECEQEFVNVDGHSCKVDFCARRYKMYEGLYDMTMKVVSTDMWITGLDMNVFVSGVSQLEGKSFLLKFLREIKWVK